MRGVVCKLSMEQLRILQTRGARLKKRIARIRKFYIEKALKKQRRHEILKMMEKESEHWLNYDNVDTGLKNSVLIPNNMHYQTDYFIRLQERALMLAAGKYDEIEENKIEHRVLQYKNSKLIPLYANLTGLLTRLRKNDLERLYEEYEIAVYGLKEAGLDEAKFKEQEQELSKFYELLIMKVKKDMNTKKIKLELLEEKMVLIFNVLLIWREYTKILNMTYEEIESLMNVDKQK